MMSFFRLLLSSILISILATSMVKSQSLNSQEGYISKNYSSAIAGQNFPFASNFKLLSEIIVNPPVIMQDSTQIYRIVTIDGNEYIGTLVEQDAQKIVLKTDNLGVITIQKIAIKSMKFIEPEKVKDGAYWADHMQSTRHFWMPNGYGLKKGEAYYQNVWVLFNQFSVGITDNILLGGGLMPGFLFAGGPTPLWFTPKVSFPIIKNKINVGAGGLFATVVSLGDGGTNFGITYGTITFGPRDKNVTLGVGYGYADGSWANSPTFTLGYISRVGRKGYFISENYLISTGDGYLFLGMIGGRSMLGSGNVGLDYGLVVPLGSMIGQFIAIPWLGITVPLGKNK